MRRFLRCSALLASAAAGMLITSGGLDIAAGAQPSSERPLGSRVDAVATPPDCRTQITGTFTAKYAICAPPLNGGTATVRPSLHLVAAGSAETSPRRTDGEPAARARSATTHTPPSWCPKPTMGTSTSSVAVTELLESCGAIANVWYAQDVATGAIIGTLPFTVVTDFYLDSANDTEWDVALIVNTGTPTGLYPLVDRIQSSYPSCSDTLNSCVNTMNDFPLQELLPNGEATGYLSYSIPAEALTAGSVTTAASSGIVRFSSSNPDAAFVVNGLAGWTMSFRCDNALPGYAVPGCRTQPGYTPILSYSLSSPKVGAVAKHIQYAQAHGAQTGMSRTTDTARQTANNNNACPSSRASAKS
jgi:hypothetical protein